ncbi:MAG: leucyl/phenylalanyl-tRNA--protein transferase [Proteobacteria bacterium]|nr:leucyl/phenylalanyl-tRNA--protein transferase [Pseudomonadota bacterium]
MTVFQLTKNISFPPVDLAEKNGLLAIGGDLSPQRLVAAYSHGIFPWYSKGDPLLWWFTNPRLVLFPDEFRIPKRLLRYARNSGITTTRDCAFPQVIRECAAIRAETGAGTWITKEMQAAYIELHGMGFAHSVECWQENRLVGGLYGIALDRVFFGESMFSRIKCASQFAMINLLKFLKMKNFQMVDCQMTTDHLLRFGAREISGREFQIHLKEFIKDTTPHENWKKDIH